MLVDLRGGCGDKGGKVLLVGENMLLCKAKPSRDNLLSNTFRLRNVASLLRLGSRFSSRPGSISDFLSCSSFASTLRNST